VSAALLESDSSPVRPHPASDTTSATAIQTALNLVFI